MNKKKGGGEERNVGRFLLVGIFMLMHRGKDTVR